METQTALAHTVSGETRGRVRTYPENLLSWARARTGHFSYKDRASEWFKQSNTEAGLCAEACDFTPQQCSAPLLGLLLVPYIISSKCAYPVSSLTVKKVVVFRKLFV